MPHSRQWVRHPVLAAVLGMLGGALTIALLEWLGHVTLGDPSDPRPAQATTAMHLVVLAAWILGAATGAWVASAWQGRGRRGAAIAATALLWAGTASTLWMIPHPWWMAALALTGMPVAGWMASRRAAVAPA